VCEDIIQLRQQMAREGWDSRDELTTIGWGNKVGYSVWFTRWDWHGKKLFGHNACYHAHRPSSAEMFATTLEAATLARKAYEEFQAAPPHLMADGSLKAHEVHR
jgi:hypothetical protein